MNPAIEENRVGKFSVSKEVFISDHFPLALTSLMFIPTKVEFLYLSNSFEMQGYSPKFTKVKEGLGIPTYAIHINVPKDEQGDVTIKREIK